VAPSNAAVPAQAAAAVNDLTRHTGVLSSTQKQLLEGCEQLGPVVATLTLRKSELEDELTELRTSMKSLHKNFTEQGVALKKLQMTNDDLSKKMLKGQEKINQLRRSLDVTTTNDEAEATPKMQMALENENSELTAKLKGAQQNCTKSTIVARLFRTCDRERAVLQGNMDECDDQLATAQAQYSEQSRDFSNCTLKKSVMVAEYKSTKSALDALNTQHSLKDKMLEGCKRERDDVALKLYKSENDALTAKKMVKKQQDSLETCNKAREAQGKRLTSAEETTAVLDAEKNQFQKLLRDCEQAKKSTGDVSSMLDEANVVTG
jgi:chromosome segregation ATPase